MSVDCARKEIRIDFSRRQAAKGYYFFFLAAFFFAPFFLADFFLAAFLAAFFLATTTSSEKSLGEVHLDCSRVVELPTTITCYERLSPLTRNRHPYRQQTLQNDLLFFVSTSLMCLVRATHYSYLYEFQRFVQHEFCSTPQNLREKFSLARDEHITRARAMRFDF
jgi:hypothetical protein